MKTTVNSKQLANALSKLAPAVAAKATLPIMECVKIVVEGPQMTLYATNLDMQLSAVIECETKKDGQCAVAFGKISAITGKVDGNLDLVFAVKKTDNGPVGKLEIKSSKYTGSIQTPDVSEWPAMEGIADIGETTEIEGLTAALAAVHAAAYEKKDRYVMHSVRFDKESIVATDGRRLSTARVACRVQSVVDVDYIRALLKSKPTSIQLACSDKLALFDCGDFQMICKLTDGSYPAWEPVIGEMEESFRINKDELAYILDRGALSGDRVKLECGEDNIVASSFHGEDKSRCETSAKGIFTWSATFAREFIIGAIQACNDEVITIGHGKNNQGIDMIRIESGNETHIVMPFRS